MLELLFIVLFCFTVVIFFIGLGNIFKFDKEARTLFMMISAILFMVLIFTSFTVESRYCVYTTEFICENIQTQEYEFAIISFLLLIINILYLIFEWLNKIPMPNRTLK